MNHLSEEQLLDLIETPHSNPHLESCVPCQQFFQELLNVVSKTRRLLSQSVPEFAPQTHQNILQMIAEVPLTRPTPFRFFSQRSLLAAASLFVGALGIFLLSSEKIAKRPTFVESFENVVTSVPKTTETPSLEISAKQLPTLDPKESPPDDSISPSTELSKDAPKQEESPRPQNQWQEPLQEESPETEEKQKESTIQKKWICGDLNQNGKLDVGDPISLLRALEKNQPITTELGDVNVDGKVDFLDAHLLARQMIES